MVMPFFEMEALVLKECYEKKLSYELKGLGLSRAHACDLCRHLRVNSRSADSSRNRAKGHHSHQ